MGGWRVAGSIEQLISEVHAISPQTVCYTIGDEAHQATDSDHNPNDAGVVCAVDIMEGFNLDLGAVAEQIRQRHNPDLKYVIYNRRIASATSNPPWSWRTYTGTNLHTDHVHTSVGVGPDGQSVQPYDDRTPWQITGGTMTDPELEFYAVEAMAGDRTSYIGGPLKGQACGFGVRTHSDSAALVRIEDKVDHIPGLDPETLTQAIQEALANLGMSPEAIAKAVCDEQDRRQAERLAIPPSV